MKMLIMFLINILISVLGCTSAYEVLYAINAGGEKYIDRNGVQYERDPLTDRTGTASDYGKQLLIIDRVSHPDEILYQTERYHTTTFDYEIPVAGDGEYALVLKFCEVYFNAPNQKVFDVVLNGEHTVISDLDIFHQVGRGVAHDEYIYFTISRGRLFFKEEESEIRAGRIRVEFVKGYRDNPKINAIVLYKGDVANIPKLPPLDHPNEPQLNQLNEEFGNMDEHIHQPMEFDTPEYPPEKPSNRQRRTSGPKQPDPYSLDDSSVMLPVFIAIGAFIPLLFCLCKL